MRLIKQVESPEKGVEKINKFYSRYHSLRYVNDKPVIRIKTELTHRKLRVLTNRFADILEANGKIIQSGPLNEEFDEPEIAHLPRLIIDFNRRDFGRLHRLIEMLNT